MSAAQTIPHEDRGTYLGSHDTSAIFSLNPFMSPINVYMNKLGMSVHRDEDDTPEQLQWGLKLQPAILKEFAKRMKCTLENEEQFIRHADLSWLGGTPDATIVGAKAGVDAKNIRWNRGEWGEEGSDAVPEYVAMQCHHFMTLLGYERWYVAALFAGCELKVYEVARDEEISDMIIKADGAFWREHIQKEIPPELDDSKSWRKYIVRKFPHSENPAREAAPDEARLMDAYRREKAKLKRRESRVKLLENRLCLAIGDSLGLYSAIGKVSNNLCKGRADIDGKRLREEMPKVAAKYEKIGKPYRRFYSQFREDE